MGDVIDPRTMNPDELREYVLQTERGVRRAWIALALSFRRIQQKELWRGYGFDSWTAYLESDMPRLHDRVVRKMIGGLTYVEEREPQLIEAVVKGKLEGASGGTPERLECPEYVPIDRLRTLQLRAREGVVKQADYEAAHQGAFHEGWPAMQIRRTCNALMKGIRFGDPPKGNSDEAKVQRVCHDISRVQAGISALRGMVRRRGLPTDAGHELIEATQDLVHALVEVLGEEGIDAVFAAVKQKRAADRSGRKPHITLLEG